MDPVAVSQLNVVVVGQLLGRALDREAQQRLATRQPAARPHFGYVFQHLVPGPMPIGQIASRMDVTQQAVSKTIVELERLGFVERHTDPGDARVRLVGLTGAGRQVVEDYRDVAASLSAELVEALGEASVSQLRDLMAASLEALGAIGAISDRRVGPRGDETIG